MLYFERFEWNEQHKFGARIERARLYCRFHLRASAATSRIPSRLVLAKSRSSGETTPSWRREIAKCSVSGRVTAMMIFPARDLDRRISRRSL